VTRYLLDTNIVSNVIKPAPSESLLAWMAAQADTALFIAAIRVAELRRGIFESPVGRKRRMLEA
jgi:predicted nucleic acid-binding protein